MQSENQAQSEAARRRVRAQVAREVAREGGVPRLRKEKRAEAQGEGTWGKDVHSDVERTRVRQAGARVDVNSFKARFHFSPAVVQIWLVLPHPRDWDWPSAVPSAVAYRRCAMLVLPLWPCRATFNDSLFNGLTLFSISLCAEA